ncbi:MAG: type III-B CRISPR module RAMP protein Cmr6 [Bradymonadaceae bacterium]
MHDRPLYKFDGDNLVDTCPKTGNAGLWYDKFCNQWAISSRSCEFKKSGDDSKRLWIETVTGRPIGDAHLLDHSYARSRTLVEACKGEALCFQTEGRFVTGLGREHPVENGFGWHPTLGTPYLPGSSVKGLVRAWAREELGRDHADISRIFGEQQEVGSVIFLDALPTAPVVLEADVMTPHYTEYYTGPAPPADWLSPNPIPFLVVTTATHFFFGILPRDPDDSENDDTKIAARWLQDALRWLGAGAKTAVGYGRFSPATLPEWPAAWLSAREQARLDKLSPRERLIHDAENMTVLEALDWTRETLVEEADLNDPSIKIVREILTRRFHELWLRGDSGDPNISNFSAENLRDNYAHKLVPPPSEEDQRHARFVHLPDHERGPLIALDATPTNDRTNPLRTLKNEVIANNDWSIAGLRLLLEFAASQWGDRKSKNKEHLQELQNHVRQREDEQG